MFVKAKICYQYNKITSDIIIRCICYCIFVIVLLFAVSIIYSISLLETSRGVDVILDILRNLATSK